MSGPKMNVTGQWVVNCVLVVLSAFAVAYLQDIRTRFVNMEASTIEHRVELKNHDQRIKTIEALIPTPKIQISRR